jgi:hypothetical protein
MGFAAGILVAVLIASATWIGLGLADMGFFSRQIGEERALDGADARSRSLGMRSSRHESVGADAVCADERSPEAEDVGSGADEMVDTDQGKKATTPDAEARKAVFDEERFLRLAKMKDKAKPTLSPVKRIENVRLEDRAGRKESRRIGNSAPRGKIGRRTALPGPATTKQLRAAERVHRYKKRAHGTARAEVKRLKSLIATYERQVAAAKDMQKRLRPGTSTYEADFRRMENGLQVTQQRIRELKSRLGIAAGNSARLAKDVRAAGEEVDALRARLTEKK